MIKQTILAASLTLSAPAFADPLPLPAGYPYLLGHSCGGVHLNSYVTGFTASGNISGEVYASTRCGMSGRGGGYRTTLYSRWTHIEWLVGGGYVLTIDDTVPPHNPALIFTDAAGNVASTVCTASQCRADLVLAP
jgi:hypothetical protein